MAIVINGQTGIDAGYLPISNVSSVNAVDVVDKSAVKAKYPKSEVQ